MLKRTSPLRIPESLLFIALLSLCVTPVRAQPTQSTSRPTTRRSFPLTVAFVTQWSDDRLASEQGKSIIANILTWQNANGGWWKGYALDTPRPATMPAEEATTKPDGAVVWHEVSTIDNGATYSEMRILARANRLAPNPKYTESIQRGLNFLLEMQYPNGGWPQRFPLQDNYGRHITFNDNAMSSVIMLLRDIAAGVEDFGFVNAPTRQRAKEAADRGIECILKCQIKVDGKLTAWCAQHDEITFAPTSARTYELVSLSGSESVSVAMLLMEIDQPSEAVKQAVQGAVEWFDRSKIIGKEMRAVPDPTVYGGRDRRIVDNPDAPPQWARFYDIETNRPFYCGRDGIKKWSMTEIEPERRNGYQWMRPWAGPMMERYSEWAKKNGVVSVIK